jgi:hypothetical protein
MRTGIASNQIGEFRCALVETRTVEAFSRSPVCPARCREPDPGRARGMAGAAFNASGEVP